MKVTIVLCAALLCGGAAQWASAGCRILEQARINVRTLDNRVLTAGRIDGAAVPVLIDTGTVFSFLTRGTADRLHLIRRAAPRYQIFGVGGLADTDETYVRRLEVGSLLQQDIWLLVLNPERGPGPGVGLVVGEKLLSRYTTEFDLAHGVIRLLHPDGCESDQLTYWSHTYSLARLVDSEDTGPHIVTEVVLNGHRFRAVLDTGARTSVITRAAAEQAGVAPWRHGVRPIDKSGGLEGEEVNTWIGRFDSFRLGDEEIRNVRLRIADLFARDTQIPLGSLVPRPIAGVPDMLIGCDFFLSHRLLVLQAEHELLFTYNGGPVFQTINGAPRQPPRAGAGAAAAEVQPPPARP